MKGVFSDYIYSTEEGISAVWILLCTGMVFLIIVGHTLFESGVLRKKNSQFILIKNLMILCVTSLVWYLCGYGLAFGDA